MLKGSRSSDSNKSQASSQHDLISLNAMLDEVDSQYISESASEISSIPDELKSKTQDHEDTQPDAESSSPSCESTADTSGSSSHTSESSSSQSPENTSSSGEQNNGMLRHMLPSLMLFGIVREIIDQRLIRELEPVHEDFQSLRTQLNTLTSRLNQMASDMHSLLNAIRQPSQPITHQHFPQTTTEVKPTIKSEPVDSSPTQVFTPLMDNSFEANSACTTEDNKRRPIKKQKK